MTDRISRRRILIVACGISLSAGWTYAATANIPLRIVVPYPPGSTTDLIARRVGEKLRVSLNKTVIVENRSGASGNIGSAFVAQAEPDGNTIVMGTSSTHVGNYFLFKNMPFHPIDDVTPITLAAKNTMVLVAHPSIPASNVRQLIDHARQPSTSLTFGSSGIGSPHHLAGELFNQMAGTDIAHVPYKGGAAVIGDLISGSLPLAYSSVAESLPHIKSGRIKVLAVTQSERYPGLPEVPSIAETLPGFDVSGWLAFFGPARMESKITQELSRAIAAALKSADVTDALKAAGLTVLTSTPDELTKYQRADFEVQKVLVDRLGIRGMQE